MQWVFSRKFLLKFSFFKWFFSIKYFLQSNFYFIAFGFRWRIEKNLGNAVNISQQILWIKKCTIFVAIIVRHQLKLGNYFGILIRIFMTLAIIFMVSEKEQANRLYASKTHSTRPFHRFFFCSHKSTSNSISVWSSCLYCSK